MKLPRSPSLWRWASLLRRGVALAVGADVLAETLTASISPETMTKNATTAAKILFGFTACCLPFSMMAVL